MRFPFLFLFALVVAGFQTACKKEPVVQIIHSDTTITGNQPPNYTGVPTVKVKLYVNKLYVDILGREPSATELETNTNLLLTQQLSLASREQIVDQLFSDTLYFRRLNELTSADFINGSGETQINESIGMFELALYLDSVNGENQYTFVYEYELDRLHNLKHATQALSTNAINVNEFYRRFLDNYLYDQINMGSENFVVASFDDLFRRAPSAAELASGVAMVDNAPSSILLTDGSNKGDFMNILTHSAAFYEGLATRIYLQLLLREPQSQEFAAAIALVQPAGNFKALQKQILTSSEYAGF